MHSACMHAGTPFTLTHLTPTPCRYTHSSSGTLRQSTAVHAHTVDTRTHSAHTPPTCMKPAHSTCMHGASGGATPSTPIIACRASLKVRKTYLAGRLRISRHRRLLRHHVPLLPSFLRALCASPVARPLTTAAVLFPTVSPAPTVSAVPPSPSRSLFIAYNINIYSFLPSPVRLSYQ